MSCYRTWGGYYNPEKRSMSIGKMTPDSSFRRLPCGRCFGCRMERSLLWSMRCRDEAQFWLHNAFLTLTYDDAHLPWHGSLDRVHLQLFLKRFRKRFGGVECAPGSESAPVRYFGCGEYGTRTKRPHYHLLLFNVRFEDQVKYSDKTFTSESVRALWPYGSHLIGSVTPASAAYVAGYSAKKVYGRFEREAWYCVVNPETGEIVERLPEFSCMSLRPGIGQYWYDRFKGDLRLGYRVVDGAKVPVPRFYERKYVEEFPDLVAERELVREKLAVARDPDGAEKSEDRLVVAEIVAQARKRLFTRPSTSEV